MSHLDIHTLAAFAATLADAARPVLLRYYRTGVDIDTKSDASPVTIADREAERRLRLLIEERFPEHGIAGEEFGEVREDAEYVWSLDPIDGTKAFITGRVMFGTLIGLMRNREPILGVIDMPVIDDRWIGGKGYTTRLNGTPVAPRAKASLGEATVVATHPDMFQGPDFEAFKRVDAASKLTLYAGDCYNFGLVASGEVDVAIEAGLADHDIIAVVPVIEAAGGVVTDWQGNPIRPGPLHNVVVAGDARVHEEVLSLLADG